MNVLGSIKFILIILISWNFNLKLIKATPYLLDIVGKRKFGNAMGILNLFRGVGCFIGPILAGLVYFLIY